MKRDLDQSGHPKARSGFFLRGSDREDQRTRSQHALNEVVDITEYATESLHILLVVVEGFDLKALQDRFLNGLAIEDGSMREHVVSTRIILHQHDDIEILLFAINGESLRADGHMAV